MAAVRIDRVAGWERSPSFGKLLDFQNLRFRDFEILRIRDLTQILVFEILIF